MENQISVVIPLYNKQATIVRALNSVLNQTVLPHEIIVVNDGSTDGSAQEVEKLNNPLIKLIHQTNTGVSAARNSGIETAEGDWIAFLDADDLWLPEYLRTMISLSQTFSQCQVLGSSYQLQDHLGVIKSIRLHKIPFTSEYGLLNNYFEVASCSHPPLWTSAVLAKKPALKSIGGFPVGIKAGEDLITWAKLALNFNIGYSTKTLSIFIQDAAYTYDGIPSRIPDYPDYVASELLRLLEQNKTIKGLRQYLAQWYKMRGSIYLRLGMTNHAIKETIRSIKYNPLKMRIYSYLLLAVLPTWTRKKIFKNLGAH